jgi:hypothetical protein
MHTVLWQLARSGHVEPVRKTCIRVLQAGGFVYNQQVFIHIYECKAVIRL